MKYFLHANIITLIFLNINEAWKYRVEILKKNFSFNGVKCTCNLNYLPTFIKFINCLNQIEKI